MKNQNQESTMRRRPIFHDKSREWKLDKHKKATKKNSNGKHQDKTERE